MEHNKNNISSATAKNKNINSKERKKQIMFVDGIVAVTKYKRTSGSAHRKRERERARIACVSVDSLLRRRAPC